MGRGLRTRTGSLSDADPATAHAIAGDVTTWPEATVANAAGVPGATLAEALRTVLPDDGLRHE